MKKRLVAAAAMMAVFVTSTAAATAYKRSITAEYGIKVEIDGQQTILTDANGKTVEPFTYNGTTYVPIRAVAENLGCYVGYDASTQTAIVDNDAMEAVTVAHKITVASDALMMDIELLYSKCDMYSGGYVTAQDASSSIASLSSNIEGNFNYASAAYIEAQDNENTYLGELKAAYTKFQKEYAIAVDAVSSAKNYVSTRNSQYIIEVNEAMRTFSYSSASMANKFIDDMWA